MNKKFVFDQKTGTMQPVKENKVEPEVVQKPVMPQPQFAEEKSVDMTSQVHSNIDDDKMRRLRELADELGMESIVLFRSQTDYTICQIVDERTGRAFAYIGGYALNIKFNMQELNSVAKVEQCLEGIKKLFRSFIVEQAIESR